MRVEHPRFTPMGVLCQDCPFADEQGDFPTDAHRKACRKFIGCPENTEEYQTACLMAEEAAKGGKG